MELNKRQLRMTRLIFLHTRSMMISQVKTYGRGISSLKLVWLNLLKKSTRNRFTIKSQETNPGTYVLWLQVYERPTGTRLRLWNHFSSYKEIMVNRHTFLTLILQTSYCEKLSRIGASPSASMSKIASLFMLILTDSVSIKYLNSLPITKDYKWKL